jgi:hypothetical protein
MSYVYAPREAIKTMRTKTETKSINSWQFGDLEGLIEQLNAIRASTNAKVSVNMVGSLNFGYSLQLMWERPMTQEEIDGEAQLSNRAEECAKDMRRRQYEKLKAEFETE